MNYLHQLAHVSLFSVYTTMEMCGSDLVIGMSREYSHGETVRRLTTTIPGAVVSQITTHHTPNQKVIVFVFWQALVGGPTMTVCKSITSFANLIHVSFFQINIDIDTRLGYFNTSYV